jgi:hypothetical protein
LGFYMIPPAPLNGLHNEFACPNLAHRLKLPGILFSDVSHHTFSVSAVGNSLQYSQLLATN